MSVRGLRLGPKPLLKVPEADATTDVTLLSRRHPTDIAHRASSPDSRFRPSHES